MRKPIKTQGRERRDVGASGDGCGLRSSAQVAGPTVLMLTASVESLEKSHFDLLSSSMSAAVQELYTSLPATLSADLASLSDPTIVLDAKPEASTFVLSCSSLPSKPHRTHGLKICSQDSTERLDCTGQASCPGLMDLLSQEPAEAGDLAEDDDTLQKDVVEMDPCHQHSREDTGGTKELGGVAEEEGLAQSYLASKEIRCLREKEPRFLPSPSNVEAAGLQRNPEESQANVQLTPENLSNLLQEAQGMKAKGTDGLFSHAGERSAREVAGVPPESSESSEVDTVMAKVEVSISNTLVSLEPVSTKHDASARELLQENKEEENCQALISCVALSASKLILPSSEAAGEKSLNQDAEANPILDSDPASMQDMTNMPNDSSSSSVLQSAAQLSNSAPEAPGHYLEGNLELGNVFWEENMDVFEIVCEMQEEDLRSCEKIELLEEWASEPDTDRTLSPACSSEEVSSERNQEQEVDAQNTDHSYSLTCEGAVEIQCYWKDIQESCRPQENSFAESSAVAKSTFPSSPAHPEDGLRLASRGVDTIQKDKLHQCASPTDITMAVGGEENRSLVAEVGNVGCNQKSCSTSSDSNPTCCDSLGCGSRLGEHVLQMESHSGPKTEILKSPSATHLCATTIADVDSEDKPSTLQLCDNYSSAQQTERNLNSSRLLDSLPREFLAELKLPSTSFILHTKKESPLPSQNAGSCITTREASVKSTGLMLKGAEQKPADQEIVQIEAYSPGNPCVNDLSSANETCCTSLGGISLAASDDVDCNSVLKSRSEESDGLKASHSSASVRDGVPPKEPGSVKAGDPHPCDDSDYAGRIWGAASPEASEESGVAAGNQRTDGNNISVKSHVELEVDASVIPADSNPELGKASLVVETDGMGAAESVKTWGESWRSGIDEKLADYRDFGKTKCLELGKFVKNNGEEKQRWHQGYHSSSSFAPEPFSMRTAMNASFLGHTEQQSDFLPLKDLFADSSGQPGKTICQTKVQPFPHQNSPFNRLVLLNQKNESPEINVSEWQQPPLMSSERQKVDHALQAVTSSEDTEKSVDCNRNKSLCSERGHSKAAVPLLLIEEKSIQETFQQTTLGSSSSVKMVSESPGNALKEESLELKSADSCSECYSELLRSRGFVNDQASQATTDESASGAVSRNPSEVLDEKAFLQCSSGPASSPNQMFPPQSPVNCQKSMERVCSKLPENKEVPTLASICFGVQLAQNPAICLSQKDDPRTSLSFSPHGCCCPFPKEHPGTISFSLSRFCCHHVNLFSSENEEASCSVKENTPRDSSLDSKETSVCTVGTKRKAEVVKDIISIISNSPDPSKKMKHSLEINQRALNLPTEKTELTVYPLGIKDSSGALLQGLRFSAGREEIAFPFKIEIFTQPSFVSLPEHVLQLSKLLDSPRFHRIGDPSKPTVVARQHLKNVQYALQTKCLLSTRLSPESFCSSTLPCPSGGHRLEASPKCLSSQGRSWQTAEVIQEPAGDGKKPLEDLLVNIDIEMPVEKARESESGVCLMLTQKPWQEEALPVASCGVVVQDKGAKVKVKSRNLLKERFFCLAPPLSSSYHEMVVKPHAFASGSGVEVSENGSPGSTFRGCKRPKRAKDFDGLVYLEAKSKSLGSLRSQSRPPATSDSPVLVVFCMLPQAFHFSFDGSRSSLRCTRRTRSPLPFRRQLVKACVKISRRNQLRTARKSRLMASSVSFRNPSAIVLKPACQLTDSVCFAPKLTVTGNKGEGTVRDQMPKQQGSQSRLLDSPRLSKLTKDPALLRTLSALANKLLALPGNPQKCKQLLSSTGLLPVPEKYSHFRHKKLLEVFSCVDMKLNFPWFNGSSCSFKMFTSQSLALYPLELTNLFFWELDNNNSSLAFSAPVFPVTFHIKLDSSPSSNLPGLTALHNDPSNSHRLALGEAQGFQPSKWTFSLFLSQSCLSVAPVQRDAWVPAESHTTTPLASLSTAKCWRSEAITAQRRRAGNPPLGLHTVLALYSPGCYRIWTRRRSLTSRLPAVQNLAALQLAQGLKELRHSASASAELFSSLPYSLGRVLSIWSHHGPPNRPSEFTHLHSKRCKWQPATSATTRLGFENSSAMLPQVPDQCVDDPNTVTDAVRLVPSFSASLRAPCSLLEPARPPLGLPVPALPVLPLDELDVPVPVLPKTGSRLEKAELEKRPKKVSQIRIRKTIPKPDPNLTPMGLPRPKRLKKTEFSLEEIYTNKNYKSPPTSRCLETIFEEPKEKNGSLISVSQQKRKRILEFQDFTIPRKRRARSRVKMMSGSTRAQKAALGAKELDVLLIQKLTDLESFFAKEEEQEEASGS